jgi:hypothetical protein
MDRGTREVWNDKEKNSFLGRGSDVVYPFGKEKHYEDMRASRMGFRGRLYWVIFWGYLPHFRQVWSTQQNTPTGRHRLGRVRMVFEFCPELLSIPFFYFSFARCVRLG